jgi:hypothetical protein
MSTPAFASTIKHPFYTGGTFSSAVSGPTGATARLAAEIKQKAFEERDAAYDRLCLHKRTCLVCNPKLKVTQSARDKRAEAQKAPWASGKAGK